MKWNGPKIDPWGIHILHLTILFCQFYFLAYTECIAYGLIDNFETKRDFFLLFHNALIFLVK